MLPFALFLLLLAGCAVSGPVPYSTRPRKQSMSFGVDPSSAVLFAAAARAAATWSRLLGRPITAGEGGDIPIFYVQTMDPEQCMLSPDAPAGMFTAACSLDVRTPSARIEVLESVDPVTLYQLLMHEMGHHLRASSTLVDDEHIPLHGVQPVHLAEPGHVMSLGNSPPWDKKPDAEDVHFICQGFGCPSPYGAEPS